MRVRGTHEFSSRVACDRALYSPLPRSAGYRLGTLLVNPVSEHELCCNDFPVFDGSLCTLDLDAMKNKTF